MEATLKTARPASTRDVPPLQSGDHLTRAEFERRYSAHPEIKKAELIEGVVYVPSPVSIEHSDWHSVIMGWLVGYRAVTPGVRVLDNASVKLDSDNEVQPDAGMCIVRGGQTTIVGRYLHGAPELIVEIAASSAAYDLHEKLHVYRRTGVQEYLVLLIHEKEAIWNWLNEGRYEVVRPNEDGIIRSRVFPGLHFHPDLFWADDLAGLLAILNTGLASPEHKAFVAALAAAGA